MPNKVGCPSKFTEEVKEKLLYAISKGAPYELACDYAGITYSCLKEWKIKGDSEKYPEFAAFLAKLKEARGQTALVWLEKIDEAMAQSWQAAAWKLERRFYKYYSNHAQMIEQEERLKKLEAKFNGDKTDEEEGEKLD